MSLATILILLKDLSLIESEKTDDDVVSSEQKQRR
jgi:hypothetical protein